MISFLYQENSNKNNIVKYSKYLIKFDLFIKQIINAADHKVVNYNINLVTCC